MMNTHSFLYSLLDRNLCVPLGAIGMKFGTIVSGGGTGVVFTRRSVAVGVLGVGWPADAMTGKLGRTLGPVSVSSTR